MQDVKHTCVLVRKQAYYKYVCLIYEEFFTNSFGIVYLDWTRGPSETSIWGKGWVGPQRDIAHE